jgi:L-fuculose-phosphate aldolase
MRNELFDCYVKLAKVGLNRGTSGNASVRLKDHFLITPSGMPLEAMSPEALVEVDWEGNAISAGKPSSEWRFHRDIYVARPDVNAIVHTHSTHATSMACLRMDIPAFHYMIAVAGGDSIRCAEYALFGSQDLSDQAVRALHQRFACLLANHGMITIGRNLSHAFDLAVEVENLCEIYLNLLKIKQPELLTSEQMKDVFEQFKGYANWESK